MASVNEIEASVARVKLEERSSSCNGTSNSNGETVERSGSCNGTSSSSGARDLNSPREDYLEWSDYFMAVSFLSAMRSKDPATQVGACIINEDKKIVGIGYNGMPIGCGDSQLPWGKSSDNQLENKYMYVCHAEMNAIMNKNSASVAGCTIYASLFPCNECAKMIIQSGIRSVIYLDDKHKAKPSTIASKKLLDMAGVTYTQLKPKTKRIVIDFEEIMA